MDLTRLDQFARQHHSLVTRRAFMAAGYSERQWYRAIELGLIDLVHPKVARMIGSERTASQAICAAVLAAGRDAMASHRSAAFLWGIPRPEGEPIDVLLPRRSRRSDVGDFIVHRPRDLKDLTPVLRTGIRTTNILRTLCDLGAFDRQAVPAAVGHVVTTSLASAAALRKAVDRHSRRGRPGTPALRDALDDWVLDGKPVDSLLEPAMRRVLLRYGLPPAEFHAIVGGYEVDFRITDSPIVLECDGWTSHGLDRAQFEKDRARDAELTALGYVVIRFTYRMLIKRPHKVAGPIRRNVERWAPHLLGAFSDAM
jgi:very-short-patch-repair endonuclease